MAERLACVVPFCRRTRGDRKRDPIREGDEWICAAHWRLVDRRTRRLHNRAKRLERDVRFWLWARCKAQALDRAFP